MGPSIKILYKIILNGGVIALIAHFLREGHPNACRMRAGGGEGVKKAKKLRAHFMYGPKVYSALYSLEKLCTEII